MPIELAPEKLISVGETEFGAVGFWRHLGWASPSTAGSEKLTGTPLVIEIGSSDLTLTNKRIATVSTEINKNIVAAGGAVTFLLSGQKVRKQYRIRVTVTTDATPARTLIRDLLIRCV